MEHWQKEWVEHVLKETWDQQRLDGSEIGKFNPSAMYFCNQYGFIEFRNITKTTYEVHIAMLRKAKEVLSYSESCLKTMRNMGAKKFIAPIAEFNKPAIMLARRCGFVQEGKLTKAISRDSKDYALLLFGSE